MKRTTTIWLGLLIAALAALACSAPSLASLRPDPTDTPRPTRTPRSTFTPTPTDTPTPPPTSTPTRTSTPTATRTPPPTDTPLPTDTARPTNTPRPIIPTATFTPAPPPPTATPVNEFSGSAMPVTDASYSCSTNSFIAVRVVDRAGKPLPGYYVHIGQDGTHFSVWTNATAGATKDPYGYNADFQVGPSKFYVTVFRDKVDPYDIGQAISNEVTVYIEPSDEDACSQSNGRNNGNKIRIAPIQFVYNR